MATADAAQEGLWEARAAIYAHFAATGQAPTIADTAVTLTVKAGGCRRPLP